MIVIVFSPITGQCFQGNMEYIAYQCVLFVYSRSRTVGSVAANACSTRKVTSDQTELAGHKVKILLRSNVLAVTRNYKSCSDLT